MYPGGGVSAEYRQLLAGCLCAGYGGLLSGSGCGGEPDTAPGQAIQPLGEYGGLCPTFLVIEVGPKVLLGKVCGFDHARQRFHDGPDDPVFRVGVFLQDSLIADLKLVKIHLGQFQIISANSATTRAKRNVSRRRRLC